MLAQPLGIVEGFHISSILNVNILTMFFFARLVVATLHRLGISLHFLFFSPTA